MSTTQYFTIKQGDLLPPLIVTLVGGETRDPQNLTGATASVHVKYPDGRLKIDSPMTILNPPTAGRIRYDWQPGDTDETGYFLLEFKVLYPGNRPQTYPTTGYKRLRVIDAMTVL